MKKLLIISYILIGYLGFGQDHYLDSLNSVLDNCKDNSTCVQTMYQIGDYEKTFRIGYWDTIIDLCGSFPDLKETKGLSHNIAGFISDYFGERTIAQHHFHESIKIFKELEDSVNLSISIWNLGVHYQDIGDYAKSLDLMNQTLEICLELGFKDQIAECYNGIAVTYDYLGNQFQSLSYYELAYNFMLSSADTIGQAYVLTNMATIYSDQGDNESATEFYIKSNNLLLASGNRETEFFYTNNNNLATIYNNQGKTEEALKMIEENLAYHKATDNFKEVGSSLLNLAKIHAKLGNKVLAESEFISSIKTFTDLDMRYELIKGEREYASFLLETNQIIEGIELALKAYQSAKEINTLELLHQLTETLSKGYALINDYENAFEFQKEHEILGNQLLNEKTKKATIGQQFEIEYLTKVAADSIKNVEKEKIQQAELAAEKAEKDKLQIETKQRRQQNIFLIIGLSITALLGLFILNRFRVTKKQKLIIENQKHQVDEAYEKLEEKNQEILDSITYAKRIQKAILPSEEKWDELMRNAFVLYLPKDIVAGDFYWLEKRDEITFFAAADCTGHGVPGAMVSVVCNSALNKAVGEMGLMLPGEILDQTRLLIIDEFSKSSEEVKDGMDIALCRLELLETGYQLMYAGANNPLWIVRNNSNDVEEIKADKQPIGKSDSEKSFTNHVIHVESGDTIYVFSDGFADQFGGDQGKKLKTGAFKKLLIECAHLNMVDQKDYIENFFKNWKQGFEQLDDVCVLALRLE